MESHSWAYTYRVQHIHRCVFQNPRTSLETLPTNFRENKVALCVTKVLAIAQPWPSCLEAAISKYLETSATFLNGSLSMRNLITSWGAMG